MAGGKGMRLELHLVFYWEESLERSRAFQRGNGLEC